MINKQVKRIKKSQLTLVGQEKSNSIKILKGDIW